MRLAIFHPAFETVGGAELLVAAQTRYFHSQGAAPELVTLGFDEARWGSRLQGIPIHTVQKRHWSDPLFGWSRLAKLRRRGLRAAKALEGYDLVIAHNFPASAMLGAAPIRARKIWQCNEPPRGIYQREANPTLTARVLATGGGGPEEATLAFARNLERHDQEMARDTGVRARHAYDLVATRNLDLIYAISEFSRDNARQIYGRCRDEVIYPIVRFPAGGRNRAGLERSVRRVLVHSRLEVLKNIDTVIRGFAKFQAASPVPCELHVVGEGPLHNRLEALAGNICVAGSVRFHGYLTDEDLRKVYDACDVFALLTLDEPFGMVYPEAAARGLLLVGPDHGGPLEILDGGRLGWVVDAFSPEALAGALEEVWELDDVEVDRRREAADRACRGRYGVDRVGPQLMALLSEA
ncbi:glycosyltransferase family 4 protein [Geothrix fuzhouensis]|uniref:glycosyltransferase family 4 protein n=1 Tax=Geothrix fuzhouensis TaxID=2966451 RepID=UPI002147A5FD|nr:glycosyltransferase family 4 protein [Geothrix fuzhouensis]